MLVVHFGGLWGIPSIDQPTNSKMQSMRIETVLVTIPTIGPWNAIISAEGGPKSPMYSGFQNIVDWEQMAQSPKGGLYGPPSKRHIGVCAIYSETTVKEWKPCHLFLSTFRALVSLVFNNKIWADSGQWFTKNTARSHDHTILWCCVAGVSEWKLSTDIVCLHSWMETTKFVPHPNPMNFQVDSPITSYTVLCNDHPQRPLELN